MKTSYLGVCLETAYQAFCQKCAKVYLYLEKNLKNWKKARKIKVLKSCT